MTETHITHGAEETKALGAILAQEIMPGTLLSLRGDLGAGKTTLVQGILEAVGAERPYVSPTFVIMKQYELGAPSANGVVRVYHADAYRVEAKDFTEIGFAEWCADTEGLVILEWPERITDILPDKRLDISITSLSENEREIIIVQK